MPSNIKDTGGGADWEPVPEGTHMARCVTVVNMGLQESPWGPKPRHYIAFEVPAVRVEWEKDGQKHEGPALIGSTYTSSLSTKAILRQHLESWRGRAFTEEELLGWDLFSVLDVPAMISVTHAHKGEKTYANISAIMGVPKGTTCPDRGTDLLAYDAEDPETAKNFERLPEWLQKRVTAGQNVEPPMATPAPPPAAPAASQDFDDDIPF